MEKEINTREEVVVGTLADRILDIQSELKVSKNRFNKFAEFHYRSCEDILEALKPLLKKHGVLMRLQDEISTIQERLLLTAKVIVFHGGEELTGCGYSFIDLNKTKMSVEQCTGSASSYARKYALNGLFLIDDQKDVDSIDNSKSEEKKATKEQLEKLLSMTTEEKLIAYFKVEDIKDIPYSSAEKTIGIKNKGK